MELKCRDVGVDCNFEVKGAGSENEMMLRAANIDPLPAELVQKVRAGMKR